MTMRKLLLRSIRPLIALLVALPAWGQAGLYDCLADSTLVLTAQHVQYAPSYFRMVHPNGDVPADRGECTDVVIRAYRNLGIDPQQKVHEDMKAAFPKTPPIGASPGPTPTSTIGACPT